MMCTNLLNYNKNDIDNYLIRSIKIAVVGAGYVGLSLSVLLSQYYEVVAVDISSKKVEMINKRISPIDDKYIEEYFKKKKLKLRSTLNFYEAFENAKFIIICTPTNYDDKKRVFDTSSIENIIKIVINMNINTTIVIKSTIPIGFVESVKKKYNINNIFFSPEFLREGMALYDNLYPSRIIVGDKGKEAIIFALLLKRCSLNKNIVIKYMSSTEAEAVKLFSNAFLALKVSYFNELDTYAELRGLEAKNIIDGVCLDPRIGDYYNNPSFGYGGYCLPKDTKQLVESYDGIPQNLIKAIVKSNDTRKRHIANMIVDKKPKTVGVYRLIMKSNSDNFRDSAILDIILILKKHKINIVLYEPIIKEYNFFDCQVENDLYKFKTLSDLIIANRIDNELIDVKFKVYSRDIYHKN